jgi:hypothetical protein
MADPETLTIADCQLPIGWRRASETQEESRFLLEILKSAMQSAIGNVTNV